MANNGRDIREVIIRPKKKEDVAPPVAPEPRREAVPARKPRRKEKVGT